MISRFLGQSKVRRKILFLLFSNPKTRYSIRTIETELEDHDYGHIHREVTRSEAEGLILREMEGKRAFYRAHWGHPGRAEIVEAARNPEPEGQAESKGLRKAKGKGRPSKEHLKDFRTRVVKAEAEVRLLTGENEGLQTRLSEAEGRAVALAAELKTSRQNEKDLKKGLREAETSVRRRDKQREGQEAQIRAQAERIQSLEAALSESATAIEGLLREVEKLRGAAAATTAPIRYTCPHCGKELETPGANATRTGLCPRCKRTHTVPMKSTR